MKLGALTLFLLAAAIIVVGRNGHFHVHHCWDTTENNFQLLKEARPGHRFTETQSNGRWTGCENTE